MKECHCWPGIISYMSSPETYRTTADVAEVPQSSAGQHHTASCWLPRWCGRQWQRQRSCFLQSTTTELSAPASPNPHSLPPTWTKVSKVNSKVRINVICMAPHHEHASNALPTLRWWLGSQNMICCLPRHHLMALLSHLCTSHTIILLACWRWSAAHLSATAVQQDRPVFTFT